MKVSGVIGRLGEKVQELVNALSNRLTAEDNWGPEGEKWQVLTSRGPRPGDPPPTFMNFQDIIGAISGGGEVISLPQGPQGPQGEPGPVGPPGPPAGEGDEFQIYDPESPPDGQIAPSYELDFKSLGTFPSGWFNINGGFIASNINLTRPGALWARSASESVYRGKFANLIPASTDFCCLFRPWIVGQITDYAYMTVTLSEAVNGMHCLTGIRSPYGPGLTYAFERIPSATSPISWNMDAGKSPSPGFLQIRRIGSTYFYEFSPDGSYWQGTQVSSDPMALSALTISIMLFCSQPLVVEGGLSVFRLWLGDGTRKQSGALRSVANGAPGPAGPPGPSDQEILRGASWSNGGSVVDLTGQTKGLTPRMQLGGTITAAYIVGQGTGSATFGVKRSPEVGFPAFADVTGGVDPSIVVASAVDVSLLGWDTSVSEGDVFEIELKSVSVFTQVELVLEITPS